MCDLNHGPVEAPAQIVGQQSVPVSGQAAGRERLAGDGVQLRRKLGGVHLLVAFDAHRAHAQLRPFFNMVGHGERGRLRGRLRLQGRRTGIGRRPRAGLGGDFDFREAVVPINSFDGARVGRHQRLRVNAVAVGDIGGMDTEQGVEGCGAEVVVARHRDPLDAPPRSQAHIVDNHHEAGARGSFFVGYLHVKIAPLLEKVAQPTIAFVEQILIDASLFEDGNQPLELLRTDVGAFDPHLDDGALLGGKAVADCIGLGVVLLGFELDLRLQPLFALVDLQHPGQRPAGGFAVHAHAGPQASVRTEFLRRHSSVTGDRDRAHPRLRAGNHVKGDVHQLLSRARRQSLSDHRLVEAVLGQDRAHLFARAAQFVRSQPGAGSQLAGA